MTWFNLPDNTSTHLSPMYKAAWIQCFVLLMKILVHAQISLKLTKKAIFSSLEIILCEYVPDKQQ